MDINIQTLNHSTRKSMEGPKKVEKIKAEELLSRFRSKEDLYRYMTQQGKNLLAEVRLFLVNVFLPSMS